MPLSRPVHQPRVTAAPGTPPDTLRSALAAKLAGEYSLFLYDRAQMARQR